MTSPLDTDEGDASLREGRTPVLQMPTAIVLASANLLLNPAHPAAVGAQIVGMRPLVFERRPQTGVNDTAMASARSACHDGSPH